MDLHPRVLESLKSTHIDQFSFECSKESNSPAALFRTVAESAHGTYKRIPYTSLEMLFNRDRSHLLVCSKTLEHLANSVLDQGGHSLLTRNLQHFHRARPSGNKLPDWL